MLILHIARSEDWIEADRLGAYRGPTLDAEGYIHCSTAEQVLGVAETFFAGQRGLVLLCIETERLAPELRFEASGAEMFPHIYGPLNLNAVIAVHAFEPDAGGGFHLPPGVGGRDPRDAFVWEPGDVTIYNSAEEALAAKRRQEEVGG